MHHFKKFLARVLKQDRVTNSTKAKKRSLKSMPLAVEELDDRCLPSSSPLTLASNHNLDYGSKVILQNVEVYQWSSTTNMGFALQQGGILDDFTYSSPTKVNATIGTNIESFGLSSDGTIYALVAGGQLQVSTNSGKTWSAIDTQSESFGVTTGDIVYDLEVGGELRYSSNRGTTWSILDYNSESIAVASSGTLYNQLSGGALESTANSGKSWITLDSKVEFFSVTTSGTLYDLELGGKFRDLPSGGSWKTLDANTQFFAVTPGNTLYNLLSGGTLKSSTNTGSSWSTIDSSVQMFSLAANGAVYVMDTGGVIRDLSYTGAAGQTLDTVAQSFDLTPNGTLYDLDAGGTLQSLSMPGAAWKQWGPVTESFATSTNGTLYDLAPGGQLIVYSQSGYWELIDSDTQSISLGTNGELFNLQCGGLLQCSNDSGNSWSYLDSDTQAFAVDAAGALYDLADSPQLLWITTNLGGSWYSLDNDTQSFTVGLNGTLYNLLSGGMLVYSNNFGSTWGGLDLNTQAFAVSENGTVYDLADSPQVFHSTSNLGNAWTCLDSGTQSFTLGTNGTLYNLLTGGLLEYSSNSGSTWTTLDGDTQDYAETANGTLYDLGDSPEQLRITTNLGSSWNPVGSNTQSFKVDTNGTLYDLQTGGVLEYSTDSGTTWTTLDTDTQAYAVSENGTLYDLADSPEALWSTSDLGNWWNWLDGNTQSFEVGTNGILYNLETGGLLEYSCDAGNTWTLLNYDTQSIALSGDGTLYYEAYNPGVLYSTATLGDGGNCLSYNTQLFAVGTNGILYNLQTGGLLQYSSNDGSTWSTLDTATQSFAVSGNGTLYDFADTSGVLWSTTDLGNWWNWLDSNTQSYTVGTDGTLYNQLTGGYLEYSNDAGNSWNTIDYATQSFAVSGNGTLYYLARTSGMVYTSTTLGYYWYYCDNRTESFTVGDNGTLYKLLIGGVLEYSNDAGNSWTTLDSDTQSFAVSANGTLFNLAGCPQVLSSTSDLGSTWNTIDNNTQAFAVGPNGGVYNLLTSGTLESDINNSYLWYTLDGDTLSFAVSANGTIYNLLSNGQFEYSTNLELTSVSWTSGDTDTASFAVGSDGTVYNLLTNGQLEYSTNFGASWNANLDTASQFTQSFAVNGSGTLFNLLTNGQLEYTTDFGNTWISSPYSSVQSFAVAENSTVYLLAGGQLICSPDFGYTWNTVDSSTQAFAMTANGTIFDLESDGTLMSWATANNILDRLVTSFSINSLNQINESDWFNSNLPDAGLATLADSDFTRDNSITRNDFIGLLEAVASRGDVTSSELTSLQALLNNSALLNMPDFVQNLGTKVVDGNPANANYQGEPLGDLAVGSSPTQVLDLVQKWFYGTDLPTPDSGLTYVLASGSLFGSAGPQPSDVVPGLLNDSPFLAALSQLAAQSPTAVESMFINNGDGTYTVRFFNNGATDYVTVNQYLPANSTGQFAYANAGQPITNAGNILWVALAEKAYAQLAEEAWSCEPSATNSFQSMNGTLSGVDVAGQINSTNAPINPTTNSVFAANPAPSGIAAPSSWFAQNMPDAELAALAQIDDERDGSITRNDFVELLEAVASRGPVTDAELTSLENLLATSAVSIPGYVQNLADKVVDGNPANMLYQDENLGNLTAGSSPTQVLDLVGKWFYGTDNPSTDGNPAIGVGYQNTLASGTLFGSSGVPNYNDVAQGEDGDCYFLAALGQLAIQTPTTIENMFTNNGDGTYTVEFFNNGVPDYVTVDGYLPTASDGEFAYANCYQYGQPTFVASSANVLWVALAEKAYSQLSEEGWSRPGEAINGYDSISGGNSSIVMEQITGSTTGQTLIISDNTPAQLAAGVAQLVSALSQNDLVCFGTPAGPLFNNGVLPNGDVLDATHLYTVQSYDTTTGIITLINPYDDGAGTRVVQIDLNTLLQYANGFDLVTPTPGMEVGLRYDPREVLR